LIMGGIKHRGFALIDVLQPCVTFNNQNTYPWVQERVYKLEGTGHDPKDKAQAWQRAQEWGDKIPIGLFFQEDRLTYRDEIDQFAKDESLLDHDISNIDISKTLEEFK